MAIVAFKGMIMNFKLACVFLITVCSQASFQFDKLAQLHFESNTPATISDIKSSMDCFSVFSTNKNMVKEQDIKVKIDVQDGGPLFGDDYLYEIIFKDTHTSIYGIGGTLRMEETSFNTLYVEMQEREYDLFFKNPESSVSFKIDTTGKYLLYHLKERQRKHNYEVIEFDVFGYCIL